MVSSHALVLQRWGMSCSSRHMCLVLLLLPFLSSSACIDAAWQGAVKYSTSGCSVGLRWAAGLLCGTSASLLPKRVWAVWAAEHSCREPGTLYCCCG